MPIVELGLQVPEVVERRSGRGEDVAPLVDGSVLAQVEALSGRGYELDRKSVV